MEPITSPATFSMLELILHASFVVQLVMLVLLLASVFSWIVMFKKWFLFRDLEAESSDFEDEFWSQGNIGLLYKERAAEEGAVGMSNLFVSGFSEYNKLADRDLSRGELVSGVQRKMKVAMTEEIEEIESSLPFLASVGSTSPYIGLFGTVWGIMNAFHAIGQAQQATIATVAPAIAEALIATAMGLFAAIPAVIAYNRLANRADTIINRYDIFTDEFLSIVNRQIKKESSDEDEK